METFAGFGEYADTEIGRLIDSLNEIGELENTLVFYIVGDNGTSAEGGMEGTFNEYTSLNGVPESVEDMLEHYDDWGGPMTYPHMAIGWAIAVDTPFSWAKQVASDFGGTRNGMVVHWPQRINGNGEIRSQFSHVIDVAPTIREAIGLPQPKLVDGVEQIPSQGTSLIYTFDDGNAPGRHTTQYSRWPATGHSTRTDGWRA
jgi:arylsulfatase A-like enzyme